MSEVWITHPELTPAHDHKVLRAALGIYAASGWRERDDQSDTPEPGPDAGEQPAPDAVDGPPVDDAPDADPAPDPSSSPKES